MALLEALLFASPTPLSVGQLARTVGETPRQVEQALEDLGADLAQRGLSLERSNQGYQLTSAARFAQQVARLLELESTSRLSKAALEVLAVVAYQQPVTRPYIDSIRGVNSESALRTLVRYGLVEEAGRTEAPGRPILYETTPEFLQYFGLTTLEQLPPLRLESEDTEGEAD